VRGTVGGTLDAEADATCGYQRSPGRVDTRAGHYNRKFHTKAGEVGPKMPKLRKQTFEIAMIERYKRLTTSIVEALMEVCLAGVSVRRVEDITEALLGYPSQLPYGAQAQQEGLQAYRVLA
jgi:transposase-like protein